MREIRSKVPTRKRKVGTQEGKLKQDAYRKKHPTERTT